LPLSHADLKSVLDTVEALNAHVDIDTFPKRLVEATHGLVGSEMGCYTEINPHEDRVVLYADTGNSLLDDLAPLFQEYQGQHPCLEDYGESRDGRARTVSEFLSVGQWHGRDLYNAFFRQFGFEDQLSFLLPTPEPIVLGLALNRSRRSFTDRDRAVVDAIRPHVEQAYRHAILYSDLVSGVRAGEAVIESLECGVVVLTQELGIRHATPTARAWLERFFPERRLAAAELPEPLDAWVRRAVKDPTPEAKLTTPLATQMPTPEGQLGLVLLRPDVTSQWILIMELLPPPVASELGTVPLSPRLREVLDLLLQGRSEKEVANELELSRHTVHDYVKELHYRFGVSSRSELLALWIRRE